ncbi:hypothetical protein P7H25_24325 [Paenibacillus larvae]|nr:hypothetical protein [Paenibacillus larvae]MDT2258043.1 hypothetical protein [Paenibacillus larvae]
MMFQLLKGADITGERLEDLLRQLHAKEEFQLLVGELKEKVSLNADDLVVRKAYHGDMELETQIVTLYYVLLADKEEKVLIRYATTDEEILKEELHAQAVIRVDGKHQLHKFEVTDFTVSSMIVDQNYTETEVAIPQQDLHHDPSYTPGEMKDAVQTQVWWLGDGCLPRGYQHCGGNCGYGRKHGGGTPINLTDQCCVLHDSCYDDAAEGKIRKCKCDAMLIDCVNENDDGSWAAIGIRLYFALKAC